MTPERRSRIEHVLKHRQNDLTVVLENVFDPHNISAVMRSCDAVGIKEIYVLNTKIPRHRKWGSKSSSSAAKWLIIHQFEDASLCFSEIRKRYENILTTHLSFDAVSLYNLDLTKSTALVFGNEHDGVSEEIRSLADGNFIIPQVGMIRSLNISVACAISLYEAFRQKQSKGHYSQQKLEQSEYEALYESWKKQMKKQIKFLFLVFGLLIATHGIGQNPTVWKLSDLNSAIQNAKEPTVINFWATFCKPCIAELPHFQQLANQYKEKGVRLIMVSLDLKEAFPKKINSFTKKLKLTSEVVFLDESNADLFCPAVDSSWSGAIPASIFINNATGYRKFFEEELSKEKLNAEINDMLKSEMKQ